MAADPAPAPWDRQWATPDQDGGAAPAAAPQPQQGAMTWNDIYESAGHDHNVDPLLLRAIIGVESGGNPYAVSTRGAQGAGQLLPRTAANLGVQNPWNPVDSTNGTAKLIDENLRRYRDPRLAILAYHGGTDQRNWGPRTRSYLQKVMARYSELSQNPDAVYEAGTQVPEGQVPQAAAPAAGSAEQAPWERDWNVAAPPPPKGKVGAGEAFERTGEASARRVLAGAESYAGEALKVAGATDTGHSLLEVGRQQYGAAEKTDLGPDDQTTIGGKLAQIPTGVIGGMAELPFIPAEAAQTVIMHGGTEGQAALAGAAAVPAAALGVLAPEFGGRAASFLVRQGVKRLVAKAAAGAAASAAAAPVGRAIENAANPADLQQPLTPTWQDIATGAAFGLHAHSYVGPYERLNNRVQAVASTAKLDSGLGSIIADHAEQHARENGINTESVVPHMTAAVDAIPDSVLQTNSDRYKFLRDKGYSEPEVKGALNAHIQEAGGKAEAAMPADAFEAEGEQQQHKDWGSDLVNSKMTDSDREIEGLQNDIANAQTAGLKKVLQGHLDDALARRDRIATAADFRRQADVFAQRGDYARMQQLRDQAQALDPLPTYGPPGTLTYSEGQAALTGPKPMQALPHIPDVEGTIEPGQNAGALPAPAAPPAGALAAPVHTVSPEGDVSMGTQPPATAVTPEGQAVPPGADVPLSTMTPGERAAAAAHAARYGLTPGDLWKKMGPRPMEALPAPEARPVTPGGQAFPRRGERSAPDAQAMSPGEQRAAAQHAERMEAPPKPPVPDLPGVNSATDVGLGGGIAKDGTVLIDKDIPRLIWMPDWGLWYDTHAEIAKHERAEIGTNVAGENKPGPGDNIDRMGYKPAHDEHGNAATNAELDRQGFDTPEKKAAAKKALQPYLDYAKEKADAPKDKNSPRATTIHPGLDPRPYEQSGMDLKKIRQRAANEGLKGKSSGSVSDTTKPASAGLRGGDSVPERRPAGDSAPKKRGDLAGASKEEKPRKDSSKVGGSDAKTVRGDSGQAARGGDASEGGKKPRGSDLQQQAPGSPGDRQAEGRRGDSGPGKGVSDANKTAVRDGGNQGAGGKGKEAAPGGAVETPRAGAIEGGTGQGAGDAGDEEAARGTGTDGLPFAVGDSAEGLGHTPESLEAELRSSLGGKTVDRLKNAGLLNIHADAGDLPESLPADTRAEMRGDPSIRSVYNPATKSAHLIASRIRRGAAVRDVLHELGEHHGMQDVLPRDKYNKYISDLRTLRHTGNAEVRAAWQHVRENYPHLDENSAAFLREAAARLMETAHDQPWVRRIINEVKGWLYRSYGIGKLDEGTLRGLAIQMLRKAGDDKAPRLYAPSAGDHVVPGTGTTQNALNPASAGPMYARGGLVDPPKEAKDIGWNMLRERLAKVHRYVEQLDERLGKHVLQLDRAIGKNYEGVKKAYYEYESTGSSHTMPELNPIFAAVKKSSDEIYKAVVASGKPMGFIENYLPHMYKDPKKAKAWFSSAFAKSPLTPASFTKDRWYQTLRGAEEAGLEPLSKNILDMAIRRFGEMKRYEQMHAHLNDLDARGWVQEQDPHAFGTPPGWDKVNDPLFRNKVVPEGIAKDLNNYLDPGPSNNPAWKAFRGIQGIQTSLNLGLSAFHPFFTTRDIINIRLDSAVRALFSGDIGHAMTQLAKLPGDSVSAFTAAGRIFGLKGGLGQHYQDIWRGRVQGDPVEQLIMQHAERGGARGQQNPLNISSLHQLHRAWNQANLLKFDKEALRSGGDILKSALGTAFENVGPIIHHAIVPAQKWLAKDIMIRDALRARAKQLGQPIGDVQSISRLLNDDATRQIMARIMDAVDDRLGQYTYVNRRIPRTLLTGLQAGLRSPGWDLGGAMTVLRPFYDAKGLVKPEKLLAPLDKAGNITDAHMGRYTPYMGYFLTMIASDMALNSGVNHAIHGDDPNDPAIKSWKDYFSIRMKDGSRFMPASYTKEALEIGSDPEHYAEGKLSPTLTLMKELYGAGKSFAGDDSSANRDFYGNQIVDPDAHPEEQLGQLFKWLGSRFTPYSVAGSSQPGGGEAGKVLPYFGVTRAPAAVADSPAEKLIKNRYYTNKAAGNLTPDVAEQKAGLIKAVQQYREDPSTDISTFSNKDQAKIREEAKGDPNAYRLSKLTLKQQIEIYDKSSPEEREQWNFARIVRHHTLSKAGAAQFEALDDDDKERVRQIRRGE